MASTVRRVNGRRTVTLNIIPPRSVALETGVDRVREEVVRHLRERGAIPADVTVSISGAADQLDRQGQERSNRLYDYLRPIPADRQLVYGIEAPADSSAADLPEADVVAADVQPSAAETRFVLHGPGVEFPLRTRLVGEYNVSNILAAASAALASYTRSRLRPELDRARG